MMALCCSAASAEAKHLRSGPHGDAQLRNCMHGGKQKEVIR